MKKTYGPPVKGRQILIINDCREQVDTEELDNAVQAICAGKKKVVPRIYRVEDTNSDQEAIVVSSIELTEEQVQSWFEWYTKEMMKIRI